MKLLREPLVHFLALGGLLFGLFALANQRPERRGASQRIVLSPFVVENLVAGFHQTAGRRPDTDEKQALIANFVREEILVREARALGLDREDPIVRGQLRQRMELLAAGKTSLLAPTASELADFLRTHAKTFQDTAGCTPPMADIRDAVRDAWQREQRRIAIDTAYQGLRARYEVVLEPSPNRPSK